MSSQTMKEANYQHLENKGDGLHILLNKDTNTKEVFCTSKNFAGWAIKYKNTHLEFMATYVGTTP